MRVEFFEIDLTKNLSEQSADLIRVMENSGGDYETVDVVVTRMSDTLALIMLKGEIK